MQDLYMSVSSGVSPTGARVTSDALFGAVWLSKGTATVKDRTFHQGDAVLLREGDEIVFSGPRNAEWVRFDLTRGAPAPEALLSAPLALPSQPENAACLLRLDQVSFPPGAVAFRHVHPGDGIRYLVQGDLQVIGDTHTQATVPGDAWFEAAHSPVRAEASTTEPQTRFIRFMVLPSAYVGKPTIRILDEHEAELPRTQVTHRFFDELAYLAPG